MEKFQFNSYPSSILVIFLTIYLLLLFINLSFELEEGGDWRLIEPHEAKFMVNIFGTNNMNINGTKLDHVCSGSLIDDMRVLTAARCCWVIEEKKYENFTLLFGGYGYGDLPKQTDLIRHMKEVRIHPNFRRMYANSKKDIESKCEYDVCVIILDRPIELGAKVVPVPIPPRLANDTFEDALTTKFVRLLAFGAYGNDRGYLKTLFLYQIINFSVRQYQQMYVNTHDDKVAKEGDQGGALIASKTDADASDFHVNHMLWGIISYTDYSSEYGSVTYCESVRFFRAWIDEQQPRKEEIIQVSSPLWWILLIIGLVFFVLVFFVAYKCGVIFKVKEISKDGQEKVLLEYKTTTTGGPGGPGTLTSSTTGGGGSGVAGPGPGVGAGAGAGGINTGNIAKMNTGPEKVGKIQVTGPKGP